MEKKLSSGEQRLRARNKQTAATIAALMPDVERETERIMRGFDQGSTLKSSSASKRRTPAPQQREMASA